MMSKEEGGYTSVTSPSGQRIKLVLIVRKFFFIDGLHMTHVIKGCIET